MLGQISMRFRQVKHRWDVLEQRFNESLLWPQGYKEPEHALAGGHLFTGGQQIYMWFDEPHSLHLLQAVALSYIQYN